MTVEELEARLETVTRERDEARDTIVALTTAMAEKDIEIATLTAALDERDLEAERGLEQYDRLVRERDEARAEVERLTAWHPHSAVGALRLIEAERERDEARANANMLEDRLSESRAEVERLTDERDELLVRVAHQDAELRATREAYRDAYRLLCAPMWEEP